MSAVLDRAISAISRLSRVHALLPWCVAFLLLLPLPLLAQNNYQIYLLNLICIMIILATGLNIVKGFCGQVTVGHVALYAIGAYHIGRPVHQVRRSILVLPAGRNHASATAVGAVVGIPSFRLEGAYLALATLAFAQAVEVYIRVTNYLGSASGIGGSPPARFLRLHACRSYESYFYLVMPIMLLSL